MISLTLNEVGVFTSLRNYNNTYIHAVPLRRVKLRQPQWAPFCPTFVIIYSRLDEAIIIIIIIM